MNIKYFKVTGTYILEDSDETEEDGYSFYYEPDSQDVLFALADLIADTYFEKVQDKENLRKGLSEFISDNDLQESLEDAYYDDLKDHFEDEAFEWENGD